jgi:hypothetical protein
MINFLTSGLHRQTDQRTASDEQQSPNGRNMAILYEPAVSRNLSCNRPVEGAEFVTPVSPVTIRNDFHFSEEAVHHLPQRGFAEEVKMIGVVHFVVVAGEFEKQYAAKSQHLKSLCRC